VETVSVLKLVILAFLLLDEGKGLFESFGFDQPYKHGFAK
jgi:hypothetical protein